MSNSSSDLVVMNQSNPNVAITSEEPRNHDGNVRPQRRQSPVPSTGDILSQAGTCQQKPSGNKNNVVTINGIHIWRGILNFKKETDDPQVQESTVSHSLPCAFFSILTSRNLDVNTDNWPNQLVLYFLPRQFIMVPNLFRTLKIASHQVLLHFDQESTAVNKLYKNMKSGLVGCIKFPVTCGIRIMVVLYWPGKKIYMGYIAHDQKGFYNRLGQRYKKYFRQRQQRLLANVPSSDGSMGNQPANSNMMPQQPVVNNLSSNHQMHVYLPVNQQQPQQVNPPQQAQVLPQQDGMPHSTNTNNQTNVARLDQLEATRQQNLPVVNNLSLNHQMHVYLPVNQQQPQQVNSPQHAQVPPQQDGMPHSTNNQGNVARLDQLEATRQQNLPVLNNLNPNNQMLVCLPVNQQQPQQVNPTQQAQIPPQQAGMPHSTNNQAYAARLNQLKAAQKQNLLKILKLQQTLEAAQQKELQFKAAKEQQQMLDMNTILHLFRDQLDHLQQLAQQQLRQSPRNQLQQKQVSEELLCKICFDQKLNIVFEPCGHLATCLECSQSLTMCPMCRIVISKKMKIYM